MKQLPSKELVEVANKQLDVLMNSWNSRLQQLALDNQFPYIFFKAFHFLALGPVDYRANDFFGQPPNQFTDLDLAILKKGCQQLLKGRGLSISKPLMGLDVLGFNALFRMFHFTPVGRKTDFQFIYKGDIGILDKIKFEHKVSKQAVTFYNFIRSYNE